MGVEHQDLFGAIGNGREPNFQAQTGGVPQRHGNDIGRYALRQFQLRRPTQCFDAGLACLLAVKQERGIFSASSVIGGQQGFDFQTLLLCFGICVGQCTCRTHCGASAATDTQVGVDFDLLPRLVTGNGLG